MRILLFEYGLSPSAPSHTLFAALTRAGAQCLIVSNDALSSASKWLKLVRSFDLVVLTSYHGFNRRELALLAITALHKPLVRMWVGSDVLYALQMPWVRNCSLRLDRFVSLNLAKGEHLVKELQSIGITSTRSITLIEPPVEEHQTPTKPLVAAVLVYLPTSRKEFYGFARVERAIKAAPNVHFIIVADSEHSLASYPNVESLGWVSGLDDLWPRVGAVLRLTEHDGTPRMVLEALARHKTVLYSWPLEGCILANNDQIVDGTLADLANGLILPRSSEAVPLFHPRNAWKLREQIESIEGAKLKRLAAVGTVLRYVGFRTFHSERHASNDFNV